MAIDTIGQLNLEAADVRARGELERGQALRGLGQSIGGSIDNALESAEKLKQKEIDVQRQKEFDQLLKSGSAGVQAYAQELGIQDPTVYLKMAESIRDPKQFANIYQIMRKRADKDIADTQRADLMTTLSTDLKDAMDTSDPDKIAKIANKINAAKIATTDKDTIKQLESIEKGLNDARKSGASKKPGQATESTLKLRNQFVKEAKDINTILRQTDILRTAFKNGDFEGNRVGSDQALVMTFNKILDPTSVVRESEFNRTGQSQGALDAAQGWAQKLSSGGAGLTEEGRAAIFKMSELISQGAMISQFMKMKEFESLADIEKVNFDLVVPGFNKHKADYMEWRENPEAYTQRITDELNAALEEAKINSKIVGKGKKAASKTQTPKVTSDMSVQDMISSLPE